MKDKILVFLKGKLTGISDVFLTGVAEHYSKTITEESAIETTFDDGLINLLKMNAGLLQTERDKRATEASKTALKTFQDKHGLDEEGKPKVEPKEKPDEVVIPEDAKVWFTKYQEDQNKIITDLKKQVDGINDEKTSEELTKKVMEHEKLKNIPELYLKNQKLSVKSEDEIEALVAEVETNYNAFNQKQIEDGIVVSPPESSSSKEGDAEFGKSIAESRNTAGESKSEQAKGI